MNTKNTIIGILIVTLIGLGIWYVTKKPTTDPVSMEEVVTLEYEDIADRVEEFEITSREHIPTGKATDYISNPPTSGEHRPIPAAWGVYKNELEDETLVHNLEHGGIWISYTSAASSDDIAAIKKIANQNRMGIIVTPREANDNPIVLASWGRLLQLQSWDQAVAEAFIKGSINNAPEPLADLSRHLD